LSLDGRRFLERELPFYFFDLHLQGLSPNIGPLTETSEVKIRATGLVKTDIQKVRIDFPQDLGWASRTLPARYDHTTGDISFTMPELSAEVRENIDKLAALTALTATQPAEGEEAAEPPAPDPNGDLAGLQVFVELSLNGQSFTNDRISFTYHGILEAGEVRHFPPKGYSAEDKVDPKAKKGKAEEAAPAHVVPGSTFGCEVTGRIESKFMTLRADLMLKAGDDAPTVLRTVELPATFEKVEQPPPPPPDPKDKNAPPPPTEDPEPWNMVLSEVPEVSAEEVPEGASVFMENVQVSMNGQHFVACPEISLKLEPTVADMPP
jgi:hypothetical protein